ncbi:MAG: hypothetical protein ACTSU2_16805 [Promethearchaeota archaeon]
MNSNNNSNNKSNNNNNEDNKDKEKRVLFSRDDKYKFLKFIFEKEAPFENFVSKAEIEENHPVLSSREKLILKIADLLEKNRNNSILIPIVGEIGVGKTHFLWDIKNSFKITDFTSFLALPRSRAKFFYILYSDFIKDFGVDNLREFADDFTEKFGAVKRLFGFFPSQNFENVIITALLELKKDNSYKYTHQLEECIKVLVQYNLNRNKMAIAERWLLGEQMDEEDLFILGVNEDLSGEYMAETMLKIIIEHYKKGVLFLFDDFDKASDEFKDIDESNNIINWANDLEEDNNTNKEINESKTSQFENNEQIIRNFQNLLCMIKGFKIIITMDKNERSRNIIDKFNQLKASSSYYKVGETINLPALDRDETLFLYIIELREFAIKNHLNHPIVSLNIFSGRLGRAERKLIEDISELVSNDELLFPLSKRIINIIFNKSKGNPRRFIKELKRVFEYLSFEELLIENIDKDVMEFLKENN